MLIFINEKDASGKTPIELAVENGYILSEENVVLLLLERGAILRPDLWDQLLTLALNQDLVRYFEIAYKFGLSLSQPLHPVRVSLHKAICSQALNVLDFYRSVFTQQELHAMVTAQDFQGFSCLEYAEFSDCTEVKRFVEQVRLEQDESLCKKESISSPIQDKDTPSSVDGRESPTRKKGEELSREGAE